MRYSFLIILLWGCFEVVTARAGFPGDEMPEYIPPQSEQSQSYSLAPNKEVTISVTGQGIAPIFATTPAQSYVLAKRAAMADAYRQLAERVKGVKIEGKDTIKNMAIKNSTVNTQVEAMIKNAKIVETTYKEGICEVEMEVKLNYNNFR
jgi:hypothetical protein